VKVTNLVTLSFLVGQRFTIKEGVTSTLVISNPGIVYAKNAPIIKSVSFWFFFMSTLASFIPSVLNKFLRGL
jgi:hypothetical protein